MLQLVRIPLPGEQDLRPTTTGQKSFFYLVNPLVFILFPRDNNLQSVRSLSAPIRWRRMKRKHIAALCFVPLQAQAGIQAGLADTARAKPAARSLYLNPAREHNAADKQRWGLEDWVLQLGQSVY